MNIIFNMVSIMPRKIKVVTAIVIVMAMGGVLQSCLQGPWDYKPRHPQEYYGVWVSAYVISHRPIDQVCFERMLGLTEESTEAFAFF